MSDTALLVIDVQVGLVTGAYRETETIRAINAASRKIRKSGGRVIYVQHCHSTYEPLMKGAATWAIDPRLERNPEDKALDKTASDAFYETQLHEVLQADNITKLVITGLQTEFCVDTTCRSALSHGYEVILISDAHTTGDSHMPAADVIAHHNKVLANLAHPHHKIAVLGVDEYVNN